MPLPERFESYKGFTISPYSVAIGERWTIGAFIRGEGTATPERSVQDKEQFAKSNSEAIDLSIAFAKRIIDSGQINALVNP